MFNHPLCILKDNFHHRHSKGIRLKTIKNILKIKQTRNKNKKKGILKFRQRAKKKKKIKYTFIM